MKSKILLLMTAFLIFTLNIVSQTSDLPKPQKKIALVIGNGNYASSILANPENDARAIANILQKLGFIVLSHINLEQKEMRKAIDDFNLELKGADVALFFYAGHGIQSRNYNYLIPVDATLQSEAQVEYDCVPADRVLALMDDSRAGIKIMILDACRNNPFEKKWSRDVSGKGLATMKASNNTFIAYSTAPGSTASDGSGNNSLYTTALLESIILPDRTIDQVFQNVGRIVSQKSNYEQIPWKASSLIVDFYFNREKNVSSVSEGFDYNLDPRDNKSYKTVKIGTQVWMQKNISYITFNNGDSIPEFKDLPVWSSATSSASCIYNNNSSYATQYGRLYNFYAVSDVRNLCPAGWHIPTNAEWTLLDTELGGPPVAGRKMKETGKEIWISPDITASNESGFSAQPSGFREDRSDYRNLGSYAGFFSAEGSVKTLASASDSLGTIIAPSFTTGYSIRCIKGKNPLVETDSATAISASKATLNGKVNPNLSFTDVSFEFGFTKGYGFTLGANQSPVTGSVPVIISADLTNLTPGTTYHYRVKAESLTGITYGNDQTIITLVPPEVNTNAATSITASKAYLNGSVNANNTSAVVTFEYGTTSAYGQVVTAPQSPVSDKKKITVSSGITGLTEKTLYHFRVKAEGLAGIITGNDLTFTTLPLPVVKTDSATGISSVSATLKGTVNTSNLPTTVIFEYGTTTDYGLTINASESPVSGISDVSVSVAVANLTPGSTYHYRVKAANQAGTIYGNDLTFKTPDILKDVAGNKYNTLIIGDQEWMAENLETNKFNDGTDIALVINGKAWSKLKKPGYCWYNNDTSSNRVAYGALYNWYTVNTFKLCPTGWHVPGNAEWNTMIEKIDEASVAGNKLKEAGTENWQKPNAGATNESGFTALPGGSRDFTGLFGYLGLKSQWWSAEDSTSTRAWFRGMDFSNSSVTNFNINKSEGLSVRCIKDKIQAIQEIQVTDSTAIVEANFFIDPRDNQRYETVKYGDRIWMAENLKATRFIDSADIPLVIDKIAWNRNESPAYCWYDNQEAYSTYGALYNWHAINSGKLCPTGWHIPSDEEWTSLTDICGGTTYAGGYLKESGTKHWEKPNTGYPPINPFKALPGGSRDENGEFSDIGKKGFWWSSLKNLKPAGWYRIMDYANTSVSIRNFRDKPLGLSVRCIKD